MDVYGGAERVAWNLFEEYAERGHGSYLAVGSKKSNHSGVLLIPNEDHLTWWARRWLKLSRVLQTRPRLQGLWRLHSLLGYVAEPRRWLKRMHGVEDFDYPGTRHLLELPPVRPDIVHCHNLHGGYFDLRILPWLSRQLPVVMTLHDAWLLSGHCAHSLDCERWETGCGKCPNLGIYPAIYHDGTAINWLRKKNIYAGSYIYIATPSQWLMGKVDQSILSLAKGDGRVIPYGIDLSTFQPGDSRMARHALGLPEDPQILLFAGLLVKGSPFKDYATMKKSIARVAAKNDGREILFVCLGEDGLEEAFGSARIRFVGFQKDPRRVADYYRAADVYLHAARADTFPNTVLEATACGTPVVATAVGGIPEQVQHGVTGFLVDQGDTVQMASRIEELLFNKTLRERMGSQAAEHASRRFALERQIDDYLNWYGEILEDWKMRRRDRAGSCRD